MTNNAWFLLLWVWLIFLALAKTTVAQPNILLIVSEDNGPELGCYGDSSAKTPQLDRLASEGTLFNLAFVTQAGCSQSRASLLTGLYPHQHGQIGLATWGFRMYRDDIPNLPSILKANGYRTGIIGKLHISPESAFPFDLHDINVGNFSRKQLGKYSSLAETFMSASDAPFFLSVNYPDAHDPWLRQVDGLPEHPQTGSKVKAMPYLGIDPPAMREMIADYYNCISRLDSLIGQLLDALEQTGKARNTIVIYLGDHGADFLRGKRTCYDGGLRVPLIVRWPGVIQPQVRTELVSTVDLMPTLLHAAGIEVPPGLPGRQLQPLFQAGAVRWRPYVFAEFHTHAAAQNYFPQRSIRTEQFKLIENLLIGGVHPDFGFTVSKLQKTAESRGIVPELDLLAEISSSAEEIRSAYDLMRQPPRYELYDLKNDPYEFRNVADSPEYFATLQELHSCLTAWRTETNDPLLDQKNLMRLTHEVHSVKGRAAAKKYNWKYPEYFQSQDSIGAPIESLDQNEN